jgi:hypothetical protein
VNIEGLVHICVVKFVMCVCAFGAFVIFDKSYKCNLKVFMFHIIGSLYM